MRGVPKYLRDGGAEDVADALERDPDFADELAREPEEEKP